MEKDPVEEVEAMLRSVPPRNIMISFDGKTAKSLEDYMKERDSRKKPRSKQKDPPPSR